MLRGTSLWPMAVLAPEVFAKEVEALLALYPREVTEVQLNLLDSHDTARYITIANGDETALRMSTLFQMVYPGAPCIYYGNEIGMAGGRDPFSRGTFNWDQASWNTDLRSFIKRAVALRQDHPALRRGAYQSLYAKDTIYALGRQLGEDQVIVAFNVGRSVAEVALPVEEFLMDGIVLSDAFKRDKYTVKDGKLNVSILPRSAVALELVKDGKSKSPGDGLFNGI